MAAAITRKTPRQQRSRLMVQTLLEATAKVLADVGYDRASTNRIAKAAGVSVGSLYQYFPNKEAVPVYVRAMLAAHRRAPETHAQITLVMLQVGLDRVRETNDKARAVVKAWLELHRAEILPRNLDTAAWMLVTAVESVTHGAIVQAPELIDDPCLERELIDMLSRYLFGDSSSS